MSKKDMLKYNGEYIPAINDNGTGDFGLYETYSRDKIEEKLSSISISGGYDWTNKVLCFEGDSTTANAQTAYPEYVCEQLGSIMSMIGISGYPVFPDAPGENWDIRRRISNIPANTDCIIILGDTNSGNESSAATSYSACFVEPSFNSWLGRWHIALNAIRKSFPSVPILLCNIYAWKSSSMKITQTKYVPLAFEALSNFYSCKHVNLAQDSTLSYYNHDDIHIPHADMPDYADCIISTLKTTKPPRWSGTSSLSFDSATYSVSVGSSVDINYTITGDKSIKWESSDMGVACVLGGTVYGISSGSAIITGTTRNNSSVSCTVTVS